MKLLEKIEQMEKEVGHVPMICIKTECLHKPYFQQTLFHRSSYCAEEIPYVKRIGEKIHILALCTLKIEDYWRKP